MKALETVLKPPLPPADAAKKKGAGRTWKERGQSVKKSKATFKGKILLVEDNHVMFPYQFVTLLNSHTIAFALSD